MEKITTNIKIKSNSIFNPLNHREDISEQINYKGVARVSNLFK